MFIKLIKFLFLIINILLILLNLIFNKNNNLNYFFL